MSGIKQIFNKEMARIFKDKKMVFSVFLLPVLIMVVILSIVNGLASNMEDDIESHVAQVYIMNKPETLNDILDASGAKFKLKDIDSAKEMKQAKKEILEGEADLIVEFPDNFRQEVEDYREGSKIPQVKTYQNPSEDYSRAAA
ncbi:ABC transporter permease, partial [[Clostridium] scindens]